MRNLDTNKLFDVSLSIILDKNCEIDDIFQVKLKRNKLNFKIYI